jgi:hypothetical protein
MTCVVVTVCCAQPRSDSRALRVLHLEEPSEKLGEGGRVKMAAPATYGAGLLD